ncbi:hypothetical protein [Fusobacterium sp.]|uniref:hypothetical protein n=1 Tax=Fusobacterium sp. TaxID=68766 RepID=UPI00396CE404
MKRLALLLLAIGAVSTTAFAGKLEVTGINQELEYEHVNSGKQNDITFTTTVNLKYDDWTFGIQGGKFWIYGTEGAPKKGLSSNNGRLQLDVWKSITPEFKLGYRFRGQKDMDRHYVRYDYSKDWFLSSADIWYESNNGPENNQIKMELFPLGVTYNGFTAKWFVNYNRHIKSADNGEKSYYEHQIRLYAPLYSYDAFALTAEGRFTLASGKTVKDNAPYSYYKNFGRTRLYLRGNYKVTDNFSLYGYYGYEFRSFKTKNGGSKPETGDKAYHDVGIGWNYTF